MRKGRTRGGGAGREDATYVYHAFFGFLLGVGLEPWFEVGFDEEVVCGGFAFRFVGFVGFDWE
jgi:hypothetical protein